MEDRKPPYDLDAEEGVLGAILIDSGAIDSIGFLKPEHFFRDKNQWIFEAMCDLYKRGDKIDQVTIGHELSRADRLEAIGGLAYMSNLLMNVPTPVHIDYYARIVWRLAGNRALIVSAEKIIDIGHEARPAISESLSLAEAEIAGLRIEYAADDSHTIMHGEGMFEYITMQRESTIKPWLTSPWESYNRTVRFRNGTVAIIAGPSSMGKTTICEQLLEHAARDLGRNGLYIFNELEPIQLLHRRACRLMTTALGKAPRFYDLEDGVYADTPEMVDFVGEVANWPGKITMLNAAGWPVHRICAEIKQKAIQGLAEFVVVDYIQLIPRDDMLKRNINDAKALGMALQRLKQTCQTVIGQPPLIVVSQVNRALRDKSDCSLNVLRDSGELGEYSNIVTFVFNRWDAGKGDCLAGCKSNRGTIEPGECKRRCVSLVTVKNTFGPKGDVLLKQIPTRYKFVEESDGTA